MKDLKEYKKQWYLINREKIKTEHNTKEWKEKRKQYIKKWKIKNKDKRRKWRKEYWNKPKWNKYKKEWIKEYKKRFPWLSHFYAAYRRCKYRKSYLDKNIKFFLTKEQIKDLWFRDKAYNLKEPSIDRINNSGDYIYSNCRFIELIENKTRPKN